MATKPINNPSAVKAVDGHGLSMKDYYFDKSTNNFERRDSPPPHVSSSELKVGSPAHRAKFPERYGHAYTSKLEQAAYPIPGTAPSEKKLIKWALEESSEPIVKNPHMLKAITDAEIQKKLDMKRGPSDFDLLKQTARTHEEKKDIREIINKEYKRNGMQNLAKDEIKYVDKSLIKPVKIFSNDDPNSFPSNETQRRALLTPEKFTKPPQYPEIRLAALPVRDSNQEAALEKMRAYAFKPTPNPDESKGIGSFKNTIGRKLRAATSRSDWEKNNRRTYE